MKISLDFWSATGLVLLASGAAALLLGKSYGLFNLVGVNLILASLAIDWGRSAYGPTLPPSEKAIAKVKFWATLGIAMIVVAVTASDA